MSALLSHQLLFLLSLFQELQFRNDSSDLTLIDNVHLGNVQHDKQEVKLAHGSVLKNDEGCNILLNVLAYLIIIQVNWRIPEAFELLLLSVKLDWSEEVLNILTTHVALILLCSFRLALLMHCEELRDLELFVMNESDERLKYLGHPVNSNLHLFLSSFMHVFTKSQLVECLKVLL